MVGKRFSVIYTTVQMFEVGKIFGKFLKEVSNAHQDYID